MQTTPLYIHVKCNNSINLDCLKEIKRCVPNVFLQANENRPKVIVLNSSESIKITPCNLGPLTPFVKPHARNPRFQSQSGSHLLN